MRCGFLFDAFLLGFAHFLLLFFFAKSEPRCGFYFGPSFFFGLLLFFCLTLFSPSLDRAAGFHFDAPLPLPLLTFSHLSSSSFFAKSEPRCGFSFWRTLALAFADFFSHFLLLFFSPSPNRAAGFILASSSSLACFFCLSSPPKSWPRCGFNLRRTPFLPFALLAVYPTFVFFDFFRQVQTAPRCGFSAPKIHAAFSTQNTRSAVRETRSKYSKSRLVKHRALPTRKLRLCGFLLDAAGVP
jgi:hypothetical protein